jgi:hypothetical protein
VASVRDRRRPQIRYCKCSTSTYLVLKHERTIEEARLLLSRVPGCKTS